MRKKEYSGDNNNFIEGGYTLGVSHHKQEEGHWCGPASSLAVIAYLISGGEPSQQDLANDWDTDNYEYGMNTDRYNGTTSPDMARSINYWIDESWYVAKAENNSTNLWAKLKFATDYQHPANILVDTKYLSWYNGKSVNHFLTARGYSQDTDGTNKKIHLVDPHYSSTYTDYHDYEPYNNVYSAVNAQSWRENTRLIVELEEK